MVLSLIHIWKSFEPDVSFKDIAKSTVGFTGADIENLLNEAALLAARRNKKTISAQDIQDSVMKVIAGPEKKSRKIVEKERRLTAVSYTHLDVYKRQDNDRSGQHFPKA